MFPTMGRSLPVEFWGYLNPVVRDRLVNYYAADAVYSDVQNTIAVAKALPDFAKRIEDIAALLDYKESIEWYDQVSPEVYSLVQREPTIRNMADQMAGKIITDYFGKVSNLVSAHDNLVWLAAPERISAINPLATRSDSIREINDFIRSSTPGASPPRVRWSMLQTLLGDDWFTKTEWYNNDGVVGSLGGLVSSGVLPRIKENAIFEKNIEALGPFNQTKAIADYVKQKLDAFSFTVEYHITNFPEVGCTYDLDRTYKGLPGLYDWANDIYWAVDGIVQNPFCVLGDVINALFLFARGLPHFIQLFSDIINRIQQPIRDGGWRENPLT